MAQQDRDRLIASKAKKGMTTQRQAAEEIGQTERAGSPATKTSEGLGDKAIHALP